MSKIIIITNDLELGGIQKSLIDFLKYLTGSDQYEIDLVLWQKDGDLKEQLPLAVNVIQNEYIATWKKIAEANSSAAKLKLFGAYLKFSLYAKIVKKPWLYYPKVKKHYDIAIAYSQNGYPRFYTVDNVSATKKFLWYHHGSYDSTKREFELDQKYFEKYDFLPSLDSVEWDNHERFIAGREERMRNQFKAKYDIQIKSISTTRNSDSM